MFKINLVPEVQQQKQAVAKRNTFATIFAIIVLAATIIVLLIMGSVKIAQNISLNNTKDTIAVVEEESAQYKELEESVLSLEAGLAGVKQILSDQNSWTRLFPHLEKATPSDIQYTSLDIQGDTVTAQLRGKSIDSLARFINSYKSYQVITLKGTGDPEKEVEVHLDNALNGTTKVNNSGVWVYSIMLTSDQDHQIIVNVNDSESSLSYLAAQKTIDSHEETVSAEVIFMFTDINTSQYTKEGTEVIFDSTFNFASEALW